VRRLGSPLFLSTAAGGRVVSGLGGLPPLHPSGEGEIAPPPPVLFVGNHQLIGPDISILVSEVWRQTGALVRSHSHPSNFGVSASGETRRDVGAVPVSGRALFRLLRRGEPTLLYPGGLREAFKSTKRGEAYSLFWPAEASFVRVAARLNASIVPVAAIGADESFEMLLDADELLQLPFLGARAEETARRTPVVLPGERFVTPLSVPAPWRFRRFYFLFGEPIATNGVDAADKAACDALYGRVRRSLEADLAYLLRQRENDPYEPFLPRVAVEASWNWTRTVPSFPLG